MRKINNPLSDNIFYLNLEGNDGDLVSAGDPFPYKTILNQSSRNNIWVNNVFIPEFDGVYRFTGSVLTTDLIFRFVFAEISGFGSFRCTDLIDNSHRTNSIHYSLCYFLEKNQEIYFWFNANRTMVDNPERHYLNITGRQIL